MRCLIQGTASRLSSRPFTNFLVTQTENLRFWVQQPRLETPRSVGAAVALYFSTVRLGPIPCSGSRPLWRFGDGVHSWYSRSVVTRLARRGPAAAAKRRSSWVFLPGIAPSTVEPAGRWRPALRKDWRHSTTRCFQARDLNRCAPEDHGAVLPGDLCFPRLP